MTPECWVTAVEEEEVPWMLLGRDSLAGTDGPGLSLSSSSSEEGEERFGAADCNVIFEYAFSA